MPEYLTPGLYVEEVSSGSRPIEGIGTSTCAFIGYAKSGEFNKPTFITSWNQFCDEFGEEEGPIVKALSQITGKTTVEVWGQKKASRRGWMEFANKLIDDAVRDGSPFKNPNMPAGQQEIKTFRQFIKDFNIPTSGLPYIDGTYLAHSVFGFYLNGGSRAYVVRVARDEDITVYTNGSAPVAAAAPPKQFEPPRQAIGPLTFIGKESAAKGGPITVELEPVDGDEFRIKVSQGTKTDFFPAGKDGRMKQDAVKTMMEKSTMVEVEVGKAPLEMKPMIATLEYAPPIEAPPKAEKATGGALMVKSPIDNILPEEIIGDEARRSGAAGLAILDDVNMICIPDLMAGAWQHETFTVDGKVKFGEEMCVLSDDRRQAILDLQCNLVAYCEGAKDRIAILDPLPALKPLEMKTTTMNTAYNCDKGQAAIYYPWIKVSDPLRKDKQVLVPPSGHIAGVWARTDGERGVHKAPANEMLRGAVALETYVSPGEQAILNPNGINAIRSFPGEGIKIYGARTLATLADPEWKYINVRRVFNFIEGSVKKGMTWAPFEPNDPDLWGRLRRNIGAFLNVCWREGMLFGVTPQEAYFVKCDASTNPRVMIDQGRVYVEVGVCPVKPAEFVIIRIGQWDGGGDVAEG